MRGRILHRFIFTLLSLRLKTCVDFSAWIFNKQSTYCRCRLFISANSRWLTSWDVFPLGRSRALLRLKSKYWI